jgi:hypothetical protein
MSHEPLVILYSAQQFSMRVHAPSRSRPTNQQNRKFKSPNRPNEWAANLFSQTALLAVLIGEVCALLRAIFDL